MVRRLLGWSSEMLTGVAGGEIIGDIPGSVICSVCGDIGSGVFAPEDSARLSVRRLARERPDVKGNFM